MTAPKTTFRIKIWHILLACLLAAAFTWYCFDKQIDTLDNQIETLNQ